MKISISRDIAFLSKLTNRIKLFQIVKIFIENRNHLNAMVLLLLIQKLWNHCFRKIKGFRSHFGYSALCWKKSSDSLVTLELITRLVLSTLSPVPEKLLLQFQKINYFRFGRPSSYHNGPYFNSRSESSIQRNLLSPSLGTLNSPWAKFT